MTRPLASRRCDTCGTKAVSVRVTLNPCGCSINQCSKCADQAAPSIRGALRSVGADVTSELVHPCGTTAPVTAWRVTREPLT